MYTTAQIAEILGQPIPAFPDNEVSVLLTDSRTLAFPDKTLFFALRTPNNDGHKYILDLVKRGVKNFVVEKVPDFKEKLDGVNFIVVSDSRKALQDIARYRREQYNLPVIGITGSRGKTIVKEWLNVLLQPDYTIARSPRSYNSQIGVPLSLWEINDDTNMGIFEAGISQPGEMGLLQSMIHPTIGVITNIGHDHDEGFSSLTEKSDEKVKLFKDSDVVMYCADMTEITDALARAKYKGELLTWSFNTENGSAAINAQTIVNEFDTTIKATFNELTIDITIPFTDKISIENAMNCLGVMLYLRISPDTIASRMSQLPKVSTRLNVIDGINNCLVVYDSYASDFYSLAPALDFMLQRATSERYITVILSDLEHETLAPDVAYEKVAQLLKEKRVKHLIGVGPEISAHSRAFKGNAQFYKSADNLLSTLQPAAFRNELILIKGSPRFGFQRLRNILEAKQHETVLEVNLDAIVRNFNNFRSRLRPTTGIVAMVKASGYGAGSYELAKTLQNQGAAYLAVAVADEGIELRKAGITMPIMILNPRVDNYDTLFSNQLEPEIYSFDILERFIHEAKKNGVTHYPVHIKLDTGMHRLGFLEQDMPHLIEILKNQDYIYAKSVFSHLAAADCLDMDDYTCMQFNIFKKCCDKLQSGFDYHILRHILNSTGITRFPEHQYDMVRLGICLYGVPTLPDHSQGELQPVSTLRTTIISIKEWDAGTSIGYCRRGMLTRHSRIATIPVGYADGIDRHLGNGHANVWINGSLCPTVGNICMDVCMIDVTDAKCEVGDSVEIFGNNISVMDIADTLDTIPYEVLTSVSSRVKRVYYRE